MELEQNCQVKSRMGKNVTGNSYKGLYMYFGGEGSGACRRCMQSSLVGPVHSRGACCLTHAIVREAAECCVGALASPNKSPAVFAAHEVL